MQFPFITYDMALYYDSIMIKHYSLKKKSMNMRASGASELRKLWHFHILNCYFFNILLVLMILCLRNIYFQVSNYICIIYIIQ